LAGHQWGNYHWARTSNPLKLDVHTAITSRAAWGPAVNGAIVDWDVAKSTVIDLNGPIPNSTSAKRCTAIPGKVLVCSESYGQRGWLGIASIWANGNHITQATTKVNDSYFDQARYNTAAWRSLVACQEMGHDFGLAHQDENFSNTNLGTCMDYTNTPGAGAQGDSNEHPNTHDYDLLKTMYAHFDSTNTSATQTTNFGLREVGGRAAPPAGAANIPGDSPAEWGTAIHSDSEGRPDVFVMNLGGGQRKITHVFWAIGEGPRAHRD